MGLVAAKCPSCGGNIQIPEGSERCYCTYCGTQILTEAAINFARVQVDGDVATRAADFDIQAGVLVGYHGASSDVVVPENVTHIGSKAFGNLPVRSIALPAGLQRFYPDELRAIPTLESITVHGGESSWLYEDDGFVFYWEKLIYPMGKRDETAVLIAYPEHIQIDGQPYLRKIIFSRNTSCCVCKIELRNCPNLEEVVLPEDGAESIVIENCPRLVKLSAPAGCRAAVSVVGCPSLTGFDLDDAACEELSVGFEPGTPRVMNHGNMPGFTALTVPASVRRLAVKFCENLQMITVSQPLDAVTITHNDSLEGVNEPGRIEFAPGTKSIEVYGWNHTDTQLVLNPGIEHVRFEVKQDVNLGSLVVREGVERLEANECRIFIGQDTTVQLPKSLSYVGESVFSMKLFNLTFPNLENAELHDGWLRYSRSEMWSSQGRCPYCGGPVGGFRTKKCKDCGKVI